jgi:hypothetical protein
MGESLIYMSSRHIVDYVSRHPIMWLDDKKWMADIGGPGDKAGLPPVPSVELWIECLRNKERLFTQDEYTAHYFGNQRISAWLRGKSPEQIEGVRVKQYRNFYPSMIDSLHVWALLAESGLFDSCIVETDRDAISKVDMTVITEESRLALAIRGPTEDATRAKSYKGKYRGTGDSRNAIELALSIRKPRAPGNKRWFDAEEVVTAILTHDLHKGNYDAMMNYARQTGVCPVCRKQPSLRVTCNSSRCVSMWTIQYIPNYYWKEALHEMIETNNQGRPMLREESIAYVTSTI